MEDWRKKAMEMFPELLSTIEESNGPGALWIELYYELVKAYDDQPLNDIGIRKIYDYADWCLVQPQSDDMDLDDVSSSAAVGFVENLPLDKRISADLHRWMSAETFLGYENLFRYHLSEDEFKRFSAEFLRRRKLFIETPGG